ncbi:hypothetical protein [Segatella oulorum]|uniref:hypothetical protein n=1 Tax=Segatella oulorum TaxID=28136 RepID=UPI0028E50274|nr:hypothetical protein [Segatella oulorum]
MKITKITRLAAMAAAVFALSACHNELDNQPDGKVNTAEQITFKVNFEDYNTDEEVQGTRALAPDTLAKQVIDLDNNLLAEVSIQRDTTKADRATTRALSNGTYTMLAYQGSTLKGEVTGTVNNGEFYVTGNPMVLAPGTYDFVLYSDLTRSGNTFIVDRSNMSNAQIGRTTGVVITSQLETQEVVFNLKHLGARMKIKLTGYMPYPAMAATLSSVNATSVPNQVVYDAVADSWTGYTNAALSENCTFPANSVWVEGNTGGASYTFKDINYPSLTNDYFYFLPTTDASKLKLTFHSGKIYRVDFGNHNVSLTLAPNPAVVMKNNGSYIINVKLRPNYLYLMSDGSTDFVNATQYTHLKKSDGTPLYRDKLGNVLTTPKVPVGLVVSQSKRLAMALKPIGKFASYMGGASYCNYKTYPKSDSWLTEADVAAIAQDMDGYRYTWEASGSADGTTIKANQPTLYPAFYQAAHYRDKLISSGVTLTGPMATKNWYLPSGGEWDLVRLNLGYSDGTKMPSFTVTYKWASYAYYLALLDVGGVPSGITFLSSSTEISGSRYYSPLTGDGNMGMGSEWWYTVDLTVIPFVKY